MRFRKLRIAFSATCLVACVLLIVLWIRSYSVVDSVCTGWRGVPYNVSICGEYGRLDISLREYDITPGTRANPLFYWHDQSAIEPNTIVRDLDGGIPGRSWFRFIPRGRYDDAGLIIPLWFPPLLMVMLIALPWVRWSNRFSLRTLLIATTLIAVLLGLVVWLGS